MREQKFVVTVRSVINKLNELCPASVEKSFKSKSMWVYRFMSRHGFTHRRVTRIIGISDEELFRRKNNFYSKVESRLGRIPETIFINIDQTCLLYGSVGSSTIDVIGARAVQVQSRGNSLDSYSPSSYCIKWREATPIHDCERNSIWSGNARNDKSKWAIPERPGLCSQ